MTEQAVDRSASGATLAVERHASMLLRVALAVSSTIDLGDLLDRVVAEVAAIVGADRASIWLFDQKAGILTSAAIFGVDSEFAARWKGDRRRWEDEPLSRLALEAGEPVIIESAADDPRTDKGAVRLFGDRSILVAPLVSRGARVGTLYLNHVRSPHVYEADEVDLIRAVAGQAAQAIWNAELYSESVQRSDGLRRSFERIGAALASSANFDETVQLIVDAAVEFLNADAGALAISDSPGAPLKLRAASGTSLDHVSAFTHQLHGRGPSEPISGELPADDGVVWSYLAVPLAGRSRTIGLLGVVAQRVGGFGDGALDLLRTFASQAAVAIEDSRLYESALEREREAVQRAEAYRRLGRIGAALNESLELEHVLAVIAESAKALVGSDVVSILIIEEDFGERLAVSVPDGYRTPIRRDGLTATILRSGQVTVVNDVFSDPRVNPEVVERGIRAFIGVPLKVDNKVAGVIYINWFHPREFDANVVSLLDLLAGQASVALKNARLFRAVVQEKEKLSAIVEHSSDGILLIDGERQVLTANPAIAQLTGWTIDEAVGRCCFQVLGCAESAANPCVACPFGSAAEGPGPYEVEGQDRSGRTLTLAVSVGRVAESVEDPALGVVMIRDISEVRRLEQAKATFVSLISHELRTPLSLVKGYLSTLRRADTLGFDHDKRQDFLIKADEASERLRRLIDDLLTASRLDTGRLNLHVRPVDLRDLVQQEASWCETLGLGRTIHLNLPADPALVEGDPQRIEEVIHNLVDNANKYSPIDEPIGIGLDRIEKDGRTWWQLTVRDEGTGLDPEETRHVFEKFYRGELASRQSIRGMGLGLAIVKGLVEAHGGEVAVGSQPGEGSTFQVILPALDGRHRFGGQ